MTLALTVLFEAFVDVALEHGGHFVGGVWAGGFGVWFFGDCFEDVLFVVWAFGEESDEVIVF